MAQRRWHFRITSRVDRALGRRFGARSRLLALGLLTGLGGRGVAFFSQLISVPLLVVYLGQEGFGILETLTALAIWIGLTNAGLNLGLLNAVMDRAAAGDRDGARREVASTLLPMGALIVAVSCAALAVTPAVPWSALFPGASASALQQVPLAAAVALVAALIGMLGGLFASVYTGYQEIHKANFWDAASRIISLLACVAVVRWTKWGITGAAAALALLPATVRAANGVSLFAIEKPWLFPRLRDFDRRLLGRNLRQSVVFFGLQMTSFAIFQLDRPIVAALRGPAEAGEYAVSARLFALGYGIFSIAYGPLWAGHGDAWRRGDFGWVRRSVRVTIVLGACCALALGVVQLVAGDRVLSAWTRTPMRAPVPLSLAFALTFAIRVWVDSRSVVLNSAGVLVPQLKLWGAQVVLAVPLSLVLGMRYGSAGVAWAVPIAALPTVLLGYPHLLRKCIAQAEAAPGALSAEPCVKAAGVSNDLRSGAPEEP